MIMCRVVDIVKIIRFLAMAELDVQDPPSACSVRECLITGGNTLIDANEMLSSRRCGLIRASLVDFLLLVPNPDDHSSIVSGNAGEDV